MSGTASRIDRVRLRAPASTAPADLASRMRQGLTQWLNQAEAACHTLSPDAIVVVRQVRAPWQALRPAAPAMLGTQPQTAAAAASLRTVLQGAQHGLPGLGATVGAGCPAVWFDNQAEVLVGLAQDALGGSLAHRWWWRQLLGQQVHDELVQRHWVDAPKHVPQALALLHTRQQGKRDTAWLRHMGASARQALLQSLASVFPCDACVLSWVRQGDEDAARRPSAGWASAAEQDDGAMRLSRLCAVLLHRPQDAADGRAFLATQAVSAAGHASGEGSLVLDAIVPLKDTQGAPGPHAPRAEHPHDPPSPAGAHALRSGERTPDLAVVPPASLASAPRDLDALPLTASRAPLSGHPHTASPQHVPEACRATQPTRSPASGSHQPQPSLQADVTTSRPPTHPGDPAGDAGPGGTPAGPSQPPVHAVLGQSASGGDAVPAPAEHRTETKATEPPPAGTRTWPSASVQPAPWSERAEASSTAPAARFDTAHAGLFFLLNAAVGLGWYGDFTQPQHQGLGLSPWQFLRAAGQALTGPSWCEDPLLAWLRAMDPTPLPRTGVRPLWAPLRARLSLAMGLPRLHATRLTVQLPGQVRLRCGRVDVHIPLSELPLPVRMAGLDRDIGWLPAAGHDIRFHFEVGSP